MEDRVLDNQCKGRRIDPVIREAGLCNRRRITVECCVREVIRTPVEKRILSHGHSPGPWPPSNSVFGFSPGPPSYCPPGSVVGSNPPLLPLSPSPGANPPGGRMAYAPSAIPANAPRAPIAAGAMLADAAAGIPSQSTVARLDQNLSSSKGSDPNPPQYIIKKLLQGFRFIRIFRGGPCYVSRGINGNSGAAGRKGSPGGCCYRWLCR